MVFDTKIYADKDELRAAVEAYLQGNHEEYCNSFDRASWLAFYERNISKEVSIRFLYLYSSISKYSNTKFFFKDHETISISA